MLVYSTYIQIEVLQKKKKVFAGWGEGKAERCFCQKEALEKVRPALVKKFEVFPPSASCSNTEIM